MFRFFICSFVSLLFFACSPRLSSPTLSSIDHKMEIEQMMQKVLVYTNAKQADPLLNLMYPKLFDLVPREMMVNEMEKLFSGNEMEYAVEKVKTNQISDIFTFENEDFAKVNYSMRLDFKFLHEEGADQDEFNQMMLNVFQATYGKEQVNLEAGHFLIESENVVLAISDKGKNNWKMLEIKDAQKPLLKRMIDQTVLKKFKL